MKPENPNFHPPQAGIAADRRRMLKSPTGLPRPLLVVSGWRTPAFTARAVARDLCRLTGGQPERTLTVGMLSCNSMASGIDRIVAAVERTWPTQDPSTTIELDVIGISMGGLLSRAAALPDKAGDRKQLNIRRLFTLGTPHRGAALAQRIAIDPPARAMRAGSPFLSALDETLESSAYELICYARTNDITVGATNTAPPGREPYWLPGPRLLSHVTIWSDPLIRLDIARRLRGEEPLAQEPSPPPYD